MKVIKPCIIDPRAQEAGETSGEYQVFLERRGIDDRISKYLLSNGLTDKLRGVPCVRSQTVFWTMQ